MLLHNGRWREEANILCDLLQLGIYCRRRNTTRSRILVTEENQSLESSHDYEATRS